MSIRKSLQSSIILMSVIPVILMAILAYVVSVTKYAQINTENYNNGIYFVRVLTSDANVTVKKVVVSK